MHLRQSSEQRPKPQGNAGLVVQRRRQGCADHTATAGSRWSFTAVGEVAPRNGKLANSGRRDVALLEEAAS
jgi:hypothetical protein